MMLIVGLIVIGSPHLRSQCSDAGVCSIGGTHTSSRQTEFGLGYGFGSSDKGSFTYHDLGIRASIPVGDDLEVAIGMPIRSTKGPAGSVTGFGDLLVTIGKPLVIQSDVSVRGDIGVRIATGSVNSGGLPQAYQAGLGTNDLLFGLHVSGPWWHTGVGYQWSPGRSANTVDRLRRGDDVLVRAGIRPSWLPWKMSAEVLGIQRLRTSVVQRALPTIGPLPAYVDIELPDTDRLQINVLLRAAVELSETLTLHPQVAMALLERPVNVDGLTRSVRFQVEVSYLVP